MNGQTQNTRSGVAGLCVHFPGAGIIGTDRADLRLQSFIRPRCIPRRRNRLHRSLLRSPAVQLSRHEKRDRSELPDRVPVIEAHRREAHVHVVLDHPLQRFRADQPASSFM